MSICWFDQHLLFLTRSGRFFHGPPAAIVRDHAKDPVVAVAGGHLHVEYGFFFLLRDCLQIAQPDLARDEWAGVVRNPPSEEDLQAWFAPYREAFDLEHPVYPAMQVRPAADIAPRKSKPRKAQSSRAAAEDDTDEEEERDGLMTIETLLPDAPTDNQAKKGRGFFGSVGAIPALGAGIVLPVIYANQLLFPPAGGGYYATPSGADAVRYTIAGDTLWKSIWCNVLRRTSEEFAGRAWPPAVDGKLFAWLDPRLRQAPLGRGEAGAVVPFDRATMHPAAILMTRRYLLQPHVQGRCALTGLEGPVYRAYERWPNGPQIEAESWTDGALSRLEAVTGGGNGPWVAQPDRKIRPAFMKASHGLRFDDWIGRAVTSDVEPHAREKGEAIRWSTPPALREFQKLLSHLTDGDRTVRSTSHAGRFQLKAFAAVAADKLLSSVVERGLALHVLSDDAVGVPSAIGETLAHVDKIGNILVSAASTCLSTHAKGDGGALGRRLKSSLMSRLDDAVLAFVSDLLRQADDPEVIRTDSLKREAAKLQKDLMQQAAATASAIYSQEFGARTMGSNLLGILKGEEVLKKGFRRVLGGLEKRNEKAA
jgi:CRISPR system Cascade subunit CasA